MTLPAPLHRYCVVRTCSSLPVGSIRRFIFYVRFFVVAELIESLGLLLLSCRVCFENGFLEHTAVHAVSLEEFGLVSPECVGCV